MENGILIGPHKDTLDTVANAIMRILECAAVSEATKVEGLHALVTVCKVKNVTIQNCTINDQLKIEERSKQL